MRFLVLVPMVMATVIYHCSPVGAQSLFWSESTPVLNSNGNFTAGTTIKRSNLDGSGTSIIADPTDGLKFLHSIAYEPVSNKLYWTDRNAGLIQRANPDGSNLQTVVTVKVSGQPSSVRGFALDSIHSTMYWTDQSYDTISRADLDGGNITAVVNSVVSDDMAIDVPANRVLYAINVGGAEGFHDGIGIANLDGSNAHSIVTSLVQVTAVDVDPIAQKVYWADVGFNAFNDTSIHRANYDGSGANGVVKFAGRNYRHGCGIRIECDLLDISRRWND